MVINTTTILAMRCPQCGQVNFNAISLFDFSGRTRKKFSCDCGAGLILFATKDYRTFNITVGCVMCETGHTYQYTLKEIWSAKAVTFLCQETDLEIGFIGPREKVKELIRNQERAFNDLNDSAAYLEFFDNPEVMYEVLEHLQHLSKNGKLTCDCGNTNIDVEFFPERLELVCSDCGSAGVIYGETKGDILAIQQLTEIQLSDQGFKLQGMGKPKKRGKQSKK